MSNENLAKVTFLAGATGCGKTFRLRKKLARPRRCRTLIYSPKEKIDNYAALYPGTVICTTANQVLAVMRRAGRGEFHIVFVPSGDRKHREAAFGAICRMAMLAMNVTVVVEEIHTVVQPNWGPDGWSELVMMGRGYGAELFALSQRPASVDKDFFSNLSSISCGRLNFDDDMKVMAKSLRVPLADVSGLVGYSYIERNIATGEVKQFAIKA